MTENFNCRREVNFIPIYISRSKRMKPTIGTMAPPPIAMDMFCAIYMSVYFRRIIAFTDKIYPFLINIHSVGYPYMGAKSAMCISTISRNQNRVIVFYIIINQILKRFTF